ncbi:MAG: flagellar biosynthetic protein FliQ [Methylobacteriaceae bacterium]|nr:flagellar biosynthetic protein FliQ [Acidimicrobiales bacterium]MCB1545624.1 flagellar biosynthetic protein FliQ [Rhodoblastus sp.]MCC0004821.1 flagellar biosynthetic protein FliQ [Methylobacteriaceae bacterium]
MNEVDALDLMRMALATVLLASAPAVGAAMLVGVVVALFQALTQIQEATLTFVPKIIAVFVAMMISGSFIGAQVYTFSEHVYGRIAGPTK